MADMFEHVTRNKLKSSLLIFLFVLIISLIGSAIGYLWGNIYIGFILAFVFAIIYSLIVFNSGDKIILRMTGVREAKREEYPHLVNSVEGLSIAAGIPTPKIYVLDSQALNAFATGKDPKNASITATTGLLKKMNRQELEGVLAHEMSHIRNYDIRFMMLTVVLIGIVVLLSNIFLRSLFHSGGSRRVSGSKINIIFIIIGLVFVILSPIIVELIRLAISRKREYLADASGAVLTRYPDGLASALEKLNNDINPEIETANKATAALFISNPFRKKSRTESSWWSTHPPLSERVRRLREM